MIRRKEHREANHPIPAISHPRGRNAAMAKAVTVTIDLRHRFLLFQIEISSR
jgi:hypothetical protein